MNKYDFTGIVVCGGNSSRMGQDKSLLQYYGKEQRYHIADMLRHFCNKVFLSLNAAQEPHKSYPFITDFPEYQHIGPMAALLSAFRTWRRTSIVMIGCDYPLLTTEELQRFLLSIANHDVPKVFFNESDGFYEPLLGFYPSAMRHIVYRHFEKGDYSLQRILKDNACEKYIPENKECILSIDDMKGYRAVQKKIADRKRMEDQ